MLDSRQVIRVVICHVLSHFCQPIPLFFPLVFTQATSRTLQDPAQVLPFSRQCYKIIYQMAFNSTALFVSAFPPTLDDELQTQVALPDTINPTPVKMR